MLQLARARLLAWAALLLSQNQVLAQVPGNSVVLNVNTTTLETSGMYVEVR